MLDRHDKLMPRSRLGKILVPSTEPMVRREAAGVRLFTRNGHDWTGRFPLIARAALSLKAASCLIDGEAVACDNDGLPFGQFAKRQAPWHSG